jgi:hypothetical protein
MEMPDRCLKPAPGRAVTAGVPPTSLRLLHLMLLMLASTVVVAFRPALLCGVVV